MEMKSCLCHTSIVSLVVCRSDLHTAFVSEKAKLFKADFGNCVGDSGLAWEIQAWCKHGPWPGAELQANGLA